MQHFKPTTTSTAASASKSTAAADAAAENKWRHPVQRFHFPRSGMPRQLYLRYLHQGKEDPIWLRPDAEAIEVKRGDTLSTNTYFNSFYEAYWSEYTALSDIALEVRFTGRLTVRVFRDVKDVGCSLVQFKTFSSENDKVAAKTKKLEKKTLDATSASKSPPSAAAIAAAVAIVTATDDMEADAEDEVATEFIPLESPVKTQLSMPRGRIFFDFFAEEDSEIHEIALVTANAPRNDVRLSIGLCTFNREEYLADTLQAISTAPGLDSRLTEVIVVNQGPAFRSEEVTATLARDPRFRVIEQPNFGGCGGFTRSMIEAQQSKTANTHHLMMDDDIVLDNRVLQTCLNVLSYARQPIVLGGHMLDTMRPSVIYEAGAFLRPNNRIVPYAHNADMADPAQLVHFSTLVKADYNAWWFCILPLAETRKIDYPAPIFIRGDDFEYGQRLAKAGVPTVSMPGVAVWHEPFYAKPPGWQQYYDLRNRLIFASCYSDKVSLDKPIDILGDFFLEPLLKHNYQVAALHMQAVEDFLDGPARLFAKRPDEKHKEINALANRYPIRKVPKTVADSLPRGKERPRPRGARNIGIAYAKRIAAAHALPMKGNPVVFLDVHAHPASVGNRAYVVTNGPQSYYLEFKPDRRTLRQGLSRARALYKRYQRERDKAAAAWGANIDEWRQFGVWQKLCELK